MANLSDSFSDAALQDQPDGKDSVAPAFNRAVTVKDAMTDAATLEAPAADNAPISVTLSTGTPKPVASEPEMLETARIISPREDLSDEAFAAVKRGDAQKLKSLLESGLDANAVDATGVALLDRAVERYTSLKRAADQSETEGAQEELLKRVDPDARADAGLAALVLAGANGNVDIAQMILDEMEDSELDDDDDDIAEETALEHGNMSVFLAIQARKNQRHDFNKAALDQNDGDREPATPSRESFGEWFASTYHSIEENVRKDAHALAAAFGRASHAVGHVTSEACHAAMAFCSNFFQHKADTPAATPTPDPAEVEKETVQAVSLLTRILHLDANSKR